MKLFWAVYGKELLTFALLLYVLAEMVVAL